MKNTDIAIAAKSKAEEDKAISDYAGRIKEAKGEDLKDALSHARKEEKDHSKRFDKILTKEAMTNKYLEKIASTRLVREVLKDMHPTHKMNSLADTIGTSSLSIPARTIEDTKAMIRRWGRAVSRDSNRGTFKKIAGLTSTGIRNSLSEISHYSPTIADSIKNKIASKSFSAKKGYVDTINDSIQEGLRRGSGQRNAFTQALLKTSEFSQIHPGVYYEHSTGKWGVTDAAKTKLNKELDRNHIYKGVGIGAGIGAGAVLAAAQGSGKSILHRAKLATIAGAIGAAGGSLLGRAGNKQTAESERGSINRLGDKVHELAGRSDRTTFARLMKQNDGK